MLNYRGHRARIDIDPNTLELTGRVECVDDVRAFRGADPLALEADFHRAVDDYRHFRELGLSPSRERPAASPRSASPALPPPKVVRGAPPAMNGAAKTDTFNTLDKWIDRFIDYPLGLYYLWSTVVAWIVLMLDGADLLLAVITAPVLGLPILLLLFVSAFALLCVLLTALLFRSLLST